MTRARRRARPAARDAAKAAAARGATPPDPGDLVEVVIAARSLGQRPKAVRAWIKAEPRLGWRSPTGRWFMFRSALERLRSANKVAADAA